MDFKMPNFDRSGSLDVNYMQLMAALGFLYKEEGDTKESAMTRAETLLAQKMHSFSVGPISTRVEEENCRPAAFFLAKAIQKCFSHFTLDEEDVFEFFNYLTDVTVDEALKNPGKHPTFERIRKTDGKITIMVCLNVA